MTGFCVAVVIVRGSHITRMVEDDDRSCMDPLPQVVERV